MNAKNEAKEIYDNLMFAEEANLSKEGLKSVCNIFINKILDITKRNVVVREKVLYGRGSDQVVGIQYNQHYTDVKKELDILNGDFEKKKDNSLWCKSHNNFLL